MLFGLIESKKKFEIQESLLYTTLNSNINFEKLSDLEEFNTKFFRLYAIDILRPALNAILTKVKNNEAKFSISVMRSWDRVAGHCVTATTAEKEQNSIFLKKNYTISIKSIEPSIIMHEIGHAIEHIAGLNLERDFKKILTSDIEANKTNNIQISSAIKTILHDELKNYELESITAELFARTYELIALSVEVDGFKNFQYNYKAISSYFGNILNFFNKFLNPILEKKIDKNILKSSNEYCKHLQKYEKKWSSKSKYSKFTNGKKWTDNIASKNSMEDKEVAEIIGSFEQWQKGKTVHKLDDGTEYFLFNDSNNNTKLLN